MTQSNSPDPDQAMMVVRPGKWTLIVVRLLREETLRFNELKRYANGVSQKMLTTTLRELERDGFVTRTVFATIPPRVDYTLTALGQELLELADSWRVFAARNRAQVELARQRFDASVGQPAIRLIHSA
ncbi:MAG: winged helix-turn-helix transcriptional regulator [Devosia sp.]